MKRIGSTESGTDSEKEPVYKSGPFVPAGFSGSAISIGFLSPSPPPTNNVSLSFVHVCVCVCVCVYVCRRFAKQPTTTAQLISEPNFPMVYNGAKRLEYRPRRRIINAQCNIVCIRNNRRLSRGRLAAHALRNIQQFVGDNARSTSIGTRANREHDAPQFAQFVCNCDDSK